MRPIRNRAYPKFSKRDQDLAKKEWSLSPQGYARSRREDGQGHQVPAHYLVMKRKLGRLFKLKTGQLIDHKDRDKMNNRRGNLRITTGRLNNLNTDRSENCKGYYFHKCHKLFMVYLSHPNRPTGFVKYCKTEQDAKTLVAKLKRSYRKILICSKNK